MHELLLFAQVLPSRHDQLVKILAGVSGMQPTRVVERHLIFKPNRPPTQSWSKLGGSNAVQNAQLQALQGQLHNELYYLQLVCELSDNVAGGHVPVSTKVTKPGDHNVREGDEDGQSETKHQVEGDTIKQPRNVWTLQFKDLPEVAGRRPVCMNLKGYLLSTPPQ